MKLFLRMMLFLSRFELAFTPKYAKHHGRIRREVEHWEGALQRWVLRHG